MIIQFCVIVAGSNTAFDENSNKNPNWEFDGSMFDFDVIGLPFSTPSHVIKLLTLP